MDHLDKIDLFLCRTHEVERIYRSLGKETYYLGFTSMDCRDRSIKKDYSSCLHAAGGSPLKGTGAVFDVWKGDLKMQPLTLVIHIKRYFLNQPNVAYFSKKLPLGKYRRLQNRLGIHLCVSETEGFGHYLVEAMSAGAVVVTTDAPPMNEYIEDKRCLVPYVKQVPSNLATCYLVDTDGLKEVVKNLASLSEGELREIGERNRAWYLTKREEFFNNLETLLQDYEEGYLW